MTAVESIVVDTESSNGEAIYGEVNRVNERESLLDEQDCVSSNLNENVPKTSVHCSESLIVYWIILCQRVTCIDRLLFKRRHVISNVKS